MKTIHYLLIVLFLFSSCGSGDDDPVFVPSEVQVTVDPLSVIEGLEQKSVFVSVRLSKPADVVVTVLLETEDGSAVAGEDYEAYSESIDFAVGSTQENVRLEIFGDDVAEIDEKFTLEVVNVSGVTANSNSGTITIENDDFGSGEIIITADGFATPDEYPGFGLVWSDEFEATVLDTQCWSYETGNGSSGWGNNELQFYQEANTTLQDGFLVIEAREENVGPQNYTSSRLVTRNKKEFRYGRIDIRAKLPEGQGIWPALWMLGSNLSTVGWPSCGEMDIMELVGHQPSTTHATVHFQNTGGNHQYEGTGYSLPAGEKFSDSFHVFSMIWVQDRIDFYVDNNLFETITPSIIGSQNPYPYNQDFFFIFNVAVGGNWPGSPDATTVFPQHMVVDYIRVFQEN